jgi:hypothetical protein
VVRSLCGVAGVVAVAWPNRSNADGIELFLEAEKFDAELLMKQLKAKLPYYMVPRRIQTLPRLPLNPNGKYDRKALQMIGWIGWWPVKFLSATGEAKAAPHLAWQGHNSMVPHVIMENPMGRPRFVIGLKSNRPIGDVGPRIPPIQRWALQ